MWSAVRRRTGDVQHLRRLLCSKDKLSQTRDGRENDGKLLANLAARIRLSGPVTVAQYMKEVLTCPRSGYYTAAEASVGAAGDFVTSPEISQMFGECWGVWVTNEWLKVGGPKNPLQLVELGPGRGTLLDDILRTMTRLLPDVGGVSVHLVEVGDSMRRQQRERICSDENSPSGSPQRSKSGSFPVHWYRHLNEVPRGFSFFLAHEFFDALPVHQFVRNKESGGWSEILIDLDPTHSEPKLRFIRSRDRTPATSLISSDDMREVVEISPDASMLVRSICDRIVFEGGAALVADYGGENLDKDTFRAFKNHLPWDPLISPGSADLTADVDFAALKAACPREAMCYGPIDQATFLRRLGIDRRKDMLVKQCQTEDVRNNIESSYNMLINEMGSRFQFLSIFPATMRPIHERFPPAGFQ